MIRLKNGELNWIKGSDMQYLQKYWWIFFLVLAFLFISRSFADDFLKLGEKVDINWDCTRETIFLADRCGDLTYKIIGIEPGFEYVVDPIERGRIQCYVLTVPEECLSVSY